MMYICDKCNAVYTTEKCPFCTEKSLSDVDVSKRLRTPSDLDVTVLVMSPPIIQKVFVDNNVFMEEDEELIGNKFSVDKLFNQWFEIYQVISQYALILTLPPNPLLQDLVWVNQFLYLPHVEEPTCIISNFAAEGRDPESDIAENFLAEMGYKTYRIPDPEWTFEGEPDCRYLKDNIYLAGYGERTCEEALDWIAEKFDAKIIKLGKTTDFVYHFDEACCVLSEDKVMVATPYVDKKALKEVEKYAEIIPVEDKDVIEFCIMNNLVIGYTIFAGTYIDIFEPDTEEFNIEMKKIETLEQIAFDNGFDLVMFEIGQFMKQGAALSCCFAHLNYADRKYQSYYKEYGGK